MSFYYNLFIYLFIYKIVQNVCNFVNFRYRNLYVAQNKSRSLLQPPFGKTDLPTHFQKARTTSISTSTSGSIQTLHAVYITLLELIYFRTSRDEYVHLHNTPVSNYCACLQEKILTSILNMLCV